MYLRSYSLLFSFFVFPLGHQIVFDDLLNFLTVKLMTYKSNSCENYYMQAEMSIHEIVCQPHQLVLIIS